MPFSIDEVKKTIRNLSPYNPHGPDMISVHIFKSCAYLSRLSPCSTFLASWKISHFLRVITWWFANRSTLHEEIVSRMVLFLLKGKHLFLFISKDEQTKKLSLGFSFTIIPCVMQLISMKFIKLLVMLMISEEYLLTYPKCFTKCSLIV